MHKVSGKINEMAIDLNGMRVFLGFSLNVHDRIPSNRMQFVHLIDVTSDGGVGLGG